MAAAGKVRWLETAPATAEQPRPLEGSTPQRNHPGSRSRTWFQLIDHVGSADDFPGAALPWPEGRANDDQARSLAPAATANGRQGAT